MYTFFQISRPLLLLAAVAALLSPTAVTAQTYLNNTERLLLFNRSGMSDRNFQRYLYAMPALNQSQFRQQQLYRERIAREQALSDQRRIQSVLNRTGTRGTTNYVPMPMPAPRPMQGPELPQIDPGISTIWHTFGVLLKQGDAAAVQSAAPAYRAGMEVVGVKTGGPAATAGWKPGDILLGLGKYRSETSQHVLYVAQSQPVTQGNELNTLVLRGGTVYSSTIKPNPSILPNEDGGTAGIDN